MNPTETSAALLKEAAEYTHSPTPQAVLDPFKEAILTLRAKYASYEIVTEMLAKHEVQVSIATVRRFCRRHHGEMKRIRGELLAQKKAASPPVETPTKTLIPKGNIPLGDNPDSPRPPRNLRGPV